MLPESRPFFRWSASRFLRKRGSMMAPRMMPAAVKRTPTSHAGGKASTVDLMTTVPKPQMAAANRRNIL